MQVTTEARLATSDDLEVELERLATAEPGDAGYLSCYLDARLGTAACRAFLAAKADLVRPTLKGTARLDFENALTMVERELDRIWHPEMQGLALFARGPAGGRFMSVLRFALPLENRLVVYRVPEILPLLALREQAARFSLLLARRGGLQVLDVDLGTATPRAWAVDRGYPEAIGNAGDPGVKPEGRRGVVCLDRPRQLIRRVVSASSGPLLLAGDAPRLAELRRWLPQRAAARLVDSAEVPSRTRARGAIGLACERFAAAMRREAQRLATQLVGAFHRSGQAVAGECATLEALRTGLVDTLVVAEAELSDDRFGWHPQIELGRLAFRQGVRVVLADSDELRYLGGVGCLLRQRQTAIAMSLPIRPGRLELVA